MQETCCSSNDPPCPLRGFKVGLKMELCQADGLEQHDQGRNAPTLHKPEPGSSVAACSGSKDNLTP